MTTTSSKMRLYLLNICCMFFAINIGIGQSESLIIIPEGVQFNDGTQQSSAATSQNPGSSYDWNVYVGYSNGIIGDVINGAYDEHSVVLRVHHQIFRDLSNIGVPIGTQHHQSFLLRKDIDKATTTLYNMFKNNTTISTITIKYTRQIAGSTTEKFRITLNNVKIAEMMTDLNFDDSSGKFFGYDTMRLIYQDITYQHFSPNDSVNISYQY